MPKYWGKQIFTHEVGLKQETEKKKEIKKEKRPKVGNNNGQLCIAKRMASYALHTCMQASWANLS